MRWTGARSTREVGRVRQVVGDLLPLALGIAVSPTAHNVAVVATLLVIGVVLIGKGLGGLLSS
jgi:hypothetical protein